MNIHSKNYLNSLNPEYKKIICQFRVSDHSLAIEKGRYKKKYRDT